MRLAATTLALSLATLPLAAPAAAQVEIEAPEGAAQLSLSVTERIEADPDLAIVTGGVDTTAPTATEALRPELRTDASRGRRRAPRGH